MTFLIKIKTLTSLGFRNLVRVGFYRLAIKSRLHPVQRLSATPVFGDFYSSVCRVPTSASCARSDWQPGFGRAFGQTLALKTNDPPDWFRPLDDGPAARAQVPWWQIADFDANTGDIKRIWEASRFDFAIPMAQRASLGEISELERLNRWLNDWNEKNPPFVGVNWKCGQEASIRVIHLITAAWMIGQVQNPKPKLVEFIRLHMMRIAPTIGYAMGQSNNHGTSEATALFAGGSFIGGPSGRYWAKIGRRALENRARVLISNDGTFSQYSTVYQRLMIDSYSFSEAFRRKLGHSPFSAQLMKRLSKATDWMEQMTCPDTGLPPNLGANDGSQIIALSRTNTRDFRPSLQLASTLFRENNIVAPDTANEALTWLGIPKSNKLAPPLKSTTLDDGGLHVMRINKTVAYLRYPRFGFRPSQADALHLDLWSDGLNLLRDAGTYSYNSTPEDQAYFAGTSSHNTVQFDGRDQMPRLGRFLFGEWLKAEDVLPVREAGGTVTAAAAYQDYLRARHHRFVKLSDRTLIVSDTISGFSKSAVLRWRLAPGAYKVKKTGVSGKGMLLSFSGTKPLTKIELVHGYESTHYMRKEKIPVVEVTIDCPGEYITRVTF